MKSLILKDIYNISHNLKSLVFVLIFLAFAFIPSADVLGYLVASAVICSTMVVTTFHFDEMSGWDGYALIMPLSRRDVVAAKYLALLLFTAFGAVIGLVMGFAGGLLTGKLTLTAAAMAELLVTTFAALLLGMMVGGMNIPLILKFGPEKGRLMLLISTMVPAGIVAAVWLLLDALGIQLTAAMLWAIPALVALWDYGMFCISCRIFKTKEF